MRRRFRLLAPFLACLGTAAAAAGEPQPVIDLLADYAGAWDMELAFSIAGDSNQRIYVGGRNGLLARVDAAPANLPHPPVETALDLFNDGGLPDNPFVMGVGPDDCAYVGAIERQKLLRVCPNGEIDEVFDGTSYPTIPTTWEFPMRPAVTTPMDLAIAPDGTLFVAAYGRLLRIDPDGSVHDLIDAVAVGAASNLGGPMPIERVVLGPDNRVYLNISYYVVLSIDATTGAVAGVPIPYLFWLEGIESDGAGGLWLYGTRLAHMAADGTQELLYDYFELPGGDGDTLRWINDLKYDGAGNLYFWGFREGDDAALVVRRTRGGKIQRVLDPQAPMLGGGELGYPTPHQLHLSGNLLYFTRLAVPASALRVELPPLPTACDDGLDNDGDGAVDWNGNQVAGADPECGGDPMRVIEHPMYCGLGFEVTLLLPVFAAARRLRRARCA